jgi:hypothetical protein
MLLQPLASQVHTNLHKDGKGAESRSESDENIGHLRKADVLHVL